MNDNWNWKKTGIYLFPVDDVGSVILARVHLLVGRVGHESKASRPDHDQKHCQTTEDFFKDCLTNSSKTLESWRFQENARIRIANQKYDHFFHCSFQFFYNYKLWEPYNTSFLIQWKEKWYFKFHHQNLCSFYSKWK